MLGRHRLATLAVATLLLPACAAPTPREGTRGSEEPIIDGTPSDDEDDAVVQLFSDDGGACTATLVAADVVLTARHCVEAPRSATNESPTKKPTSTKTSKKQAAAKGGSGATSLDGCGPFRENLPAQQLSVVLGRRLGKATPDRIAARGAELFVPERADMCGHDIAILKLDRAIPNARTAAIRLTPLRVGESRLSAVGFGLTSTDGTVPDERLRRNDLEVLGLGGESPIVYRRASGETLTFTLPENDLATGESTCNGDSGGPLFDRDGRIVAVTSRGLSVDDDCRDAPAVWAGLAGHADLLRRVASATGLQVE